MGLLKLGSDAIRSVVRNTKNRLATFGKHKKDIGLPVEQQELQEFLKNSPKEFRKFNRKTKMYEPKIPRGALKESEEYQQYILELNNELNTSSSYQDIERFIKQYEKATTTKKHEGIKLTFDEASKLRELSKEVRSSSTPYRQQEDRAYAGFNGLIYAKKNGANLTYQDMIEFYEARRDKFDRMQVNEIYNYIDDYFNVKLDLKDEVPF